MKYTNAQEILPKEVLETIYKYLDGGYLYIPRQDEKKKSWGESSGIKSEIKVRNLEIYNKYLSDISIDKLSEEYYLSKSSIKRIIGECKKKVTNID